MELKLTAVSSAQGFDICATQMISPFLPMGHTVLKQLEFLMRVKYKFRIHIRPQSKHSASVVLAREVDQLCVEQPELLDVDTDAKGA